MQNKKSFEIILHVGRVASLQSWVPKKSCHDQTLINECSISDYPSNFQLPTTYFKRFFALHSSEVIFSFLIKKSRLKAIEIEIAFFHSLGNPKGRTLDHFLCFTYPSQLPLQTDTYIDELVEIFLKLSMKTVQVQLIIGATLRGCSQVEN